MRHVPSSSSTETAVVGSGILGLLVAAHLAEGGREVTVVAGRERVDQIPRRDSQRNHMWLQSGLLYVDALGPDFAMSMWDDGARLLEYVALSRPRDGGVFRFSSLASADRFRGLIRQCRLDAHARRCPGRC